MQFKKKLIIIGSGGMQNPADIVSTKNFQLKV